MIKIGGWQKVTLIDYPGKLAASVFLVGCNFLCHYCHNPELIKVEPDKKYLSNQAFFDYLKKRQGILEAVCVSGGEPLLFPEVIDFLQKIKKLDYKIKLDTNGTSPDFLQELIDKKLINFIAMDVKASLENYSQVCGVKVDINKIQKTIKLIMNSGLNYEFRTTVLPKFHNLEEIEKIAKIIKGAKIYFLQNFNNKITLNPDLANEQSFSGQELQKLKKLALKYVKNCQIRENL
ncbi:MAG: anaerobic ribonucleoside-triphosphate reductase activating protein|nr:anaerobic ribonucleoside-triphosphate reductase activating protein [Candidatus Buchananbacteria bacterium]